MPAPDALLRPPPLLLLLRRRRRQWRPHPMLSRNLAILSRNLVRGARLGRRQEGRGRRGPDLAPARRQQHRGTRRPPRSAARLRLLRLLQSRGSPLPLDHHCSAAAGARRVQLGRTEGCPRSISLSSSRSLHFLRRFVKLRLSARSPPPPPPPPSSLFLPIPRFPLLLLRVAVRRTRLPSLPANPKATPKQASLTRSGVVFLGEVEVLCCRHSTLLSLLLALHWNTLPNWRKKEVSFRFGPRHSTD